MELQITGQNIEVSSKVRQYVEKKVGKLSRHLPNIMMGKVEIVEERTKSPENRFVVQTTLDASGTLLRGEERGGDLFTAIDRVADVMDRQVERYKGKLYFKGRDTVREAPAEGTPITPPAAPAGKVVKTKRFNIKPMSVDAAIQQMELLGHDFFLFYNDDTKALNLVYRRLDGDYGLIEPVLP